MTRTTKAGRPRGTLRLHSVIDHDADGDPVTVRDRLLQWVAQGCPQDIAAAKAGVGRATILHWMHEAAAITERQAVNPYSRLTRAEQDLVDFSAQLEAARAAHAAHLLGLVNGHADGGLEKVTRRAKDKLGPPGADGTRAVLETERTVITETTLPSEAAARWLLERQYGMTQSVEIRVEGGVLDDDTRLAELATAMREFLAERRGLPSPDALGAIDARSHASDEAEPLGGGE